MTTEREPTPDYCIVKMTLGVRMKAIEYESNKSFDGRAEQFVRDVLPELHQHLEAAANKYLKDAECHGFSCEMILES